MTPMTFKQSDRAVELYRAAFEALTSLSEERLNLDAATIEMLNEARGALERSDALRAFQPKQVRV